MKRLLAVLSAGNASGSSSGAGRTEAGAPDIVRPNEPYLWLGLTCATSDS